MHSNISSNGRGSSSNNAKQQENNLNKYFIFDWGYPAAAMEGAAGRFIASISESGPSSPGRLIANKMHDNLQESSDPDDLGGPKLCYKISFIKKRSTKDGSAMGPEALFSRHNTSIMMTRSMG